MQLKVSRNVVSGPLSSGYLVLNVSVLIFADVSADLKKKPKGKKKKKQEEEEEKRTPEEEEELERQKVRGQTHPSSAELITEKTDKIIIIIKLVTSVCAG